MCNCINKVVLVIVNVIFLIAGAAIVGVSIWVIVGKDKMFKLVHIATQGSSINDAALSNYENSTSTLLAAAYVVLAFGALSLVIGFCGCCGAIRESSCLLMVYAGAITVILLVEIAGGIAAGVFRYQITNQLKPTLTELEAKRFIPINLAANNDTSPNSIFSSYVNYAQVLLGCCGVSGPLDIIGNDTLWSKSNRIDSRNKTQYVPATCCKISKSDTLLTTMNWTSVDSFLDDPNCPYTQYNSSSTTMNTQGCFDKLNSYIDQYAIAIIIVGIVVGLFEIICVVMACSMIQKIRSEGGKHTV